MEALDVRISGLMVLYQFSNALANGWALLDSSKSQMVKLARRTENGTLPTVDAIETALRQAPRTGTVPYEDGRHYIVMRVVVQGFLTPTRREAQRVLLTSTGTPFEKEMLARISQLERVRLICIADNSSYSSRKNWLEGRGRRQIWFDWKPLGVEGRSELSRRRIDALIPIPSLNDLKMLRSRIKVKVADGAVSMELTDSKESSDTLLQIRDAWKLYQEHLVALTTIANYYEKTQAKRRVRH